MAGMIRLWSVGRWVWRVGSSAKRPTPHAITLLTLLLVLTLPAQAQVVDDMIDAEVALTEATTLVAGKQATVTYASGAVAATYNGIALQGFADDPELEGFVRFLSNARWTDWHPLYLVRSSTDGAFLAAYRDSTYRQGFSFELRFTVDADVPIRIHTIGVFDSRNDADRTPVPGALGQQNAAQGLIIPPILNTRAAWGAEPFRGTPVPLARPDYTRMTFHHAAGFTAENLEEGKAQVKAIQTFHQNGRGWSDIGYQFVVDRAGNVYQGRPFLDNAITLDDIPRLAQGAHVGGANTGNIGVCLLGCYHPPETAYPCNDVITPAALDSMITLFAFLSEAYGVDPDNLLGHRDQGATSCPGDNNYKLLPEVRRDIIALKLTGNARLGSADLTAEAGTDGVVNVAWAFTQDNGITGYRLERIYQGQTTVVATGEGALANQFTDPGLAEGGTARYDLYAVNAAGRQQRLSSTEVTVATPATYLLASTYPNPFAGQTTVRYFLRQEGIVRLYVYDGAGRQVSTLVEGFQAGERWYTVPFEAQGLASGTYYYRIEVEGFSGVVFSETKAMTVVR